MKRPSSVARSGERPALRGHARRSMPAQPQGPLRRVYRQAQVKRGTKETRVTVKLKLDGTGKSSVNTGIPFFDHMLTLFAKHAVVDLTLRCAGDLEVDAHHSVEDCGIALGQAFARALGDKRGVRRYGTGFHARNPFTAEAYVPM